MNLTLRLLGLILVTSLALPSCVSKKKFQQLEDEKKAIANSLAESQTKVNQLEEKVTSLETEMTNEKNRLNNELSMLRKDMDAAKADAANAKSQLAAKDAEIAKIKKDIKDAFGLTSDVTVESRENGVYVVLDKSVQYKTGSTRLNKDARTSIEKLATTMKNNPNLHLLVEGHTDSDKYPSSAGYNNWDLSVDRAMAVVKRLIKLGVKPEQLTVAGRGDASPAAANDNKDNKSKNRRTEVKPDPNDGAIYKIGN
ncbi:MAG: OmpA family protein [Bacteroidota bacterium]